MSFSKTPLTDELKEILSKCILPQSNEVAGDCLEKLRSINFVEPAAEQTKPVKWIITDAGQNYLSQKSQ